MRISLSIVLEKYLRWSSWKDRESDELLSFVNDTVLKKIGEKYKDEDIFTPLSIKNPKILKKIIKKLFRDFIYIIFK